MAVSLKWNAWQFHVDHCFSGWQLWSKCTSCKIKHQQVFHFLFPHDLTTMFLVGGLRIRAHMWFHVRRWATEKITDQNQEHFMNWNNKFETLLSLRLSTSSRTVESVFQTALHFNVWGLNCLTTVSKQHPISQIHPFNFMHLVSDHGIECSALLIKMPVTGLVPFTYSYNLLS